MKVNHKELSSVLEGEGTLNGWFYLNLYDFAADKKVADRDQYVRRWVMLEKNVLLTSKSEHGSLETVLILENLTVQVCQSRYHGYGLKLEFPNSEYHLYCSSKELAELWMTELTNCGYMALYRQWNDLQVEYNTVMAQQNRISRCYDQDFLLPTDNFREVVVSCDLPVNCPTQNTFASVYAERFNKWFLWYQTENADHTLTPHYSKTFHFELDDKNLADSSNLKFCINNMNTGHILGYVITSLSAIQSSADSKLVTSLQDDHGNGNVGTIILELSSSYCNTLPTSHHSLLHIVSNSEALLLDSHRGFMFSTNFGKVHVSEQLWDHSATIAFPLAYIRFLLRSKETILSSYEEFRTLDPRYDATIAQMITHHETSLLNLLAAEKYLDGYSGPMYRRSVQKKEREWQYCPVNLAIYAVGVCDPEDLETNYFTTTVGAFTSHGIGYKQSLHSTLVQAGKNSLHSIRHDRVMENINMLYRIWGDIESFKQRLIDALALENCDVYDIAVSLTTKISDLTEWCKQGDVVAGIQLMGQDEVTENHVQVRQRGWSTPETDYVWDGERYRVTSTGSQSSPHQETQVTMAITRFIQAIERKERGLGRDLVRMLSSLEPIVTRSRQGLMFMLLLEEHKIFNSFFSFNADVEMRMNHAFSQGLAALYTAFHMTLLDAFMRKDVTYFDILDHIGFLVQFQSLLSTCGNELVMLEDHWIVVNNLSNTKLVLSPEELGSYTLAGLPYKVTVTIGVGADIWGVLPAGLKNSKPVPVTTVLFTKGVNETQFVVERVGGNTLEHTINVDGLCQLEVYYMLYKEYIVHRGDVACNLPKLDSLMTLISKQVRAHINRDIKLLVLVDEAVRLMCGARVTSCKSAKDRTGMSVTYEAVCALSRNHQLLATGFVNALAALRSHGVRPLNCKKNTGCSKYAFNALQLMTFPKEYKPPIGTFGGKVT